MLPQLDLKHFVQTLLLGFAISSIAVTAQAAGPTVILVHGVESSGDPKDFRYPYLPIKNWIAKSVPNSTVIDFDWAKGSPDNPGQASIQIGTRADVISGMSTKAWKGADELKEVIGQQAGPICIIAHSQGTALTLAALGSSKRVNCVVIMGSPLYQGFIQAPLRAGYKNFDVLINLASIDDMTVTLPEQIKKAIDGYAIGRSGLPDLSGGGLLKKSNATNHTTYFNPTDGPVVENISFAEVTHSGDKGWWSAWWLEDAAIWPQSFSLEKFKQTLQLKPSN